MILRAAGGYTLPLVRHRTVQALPEEAVHRKTPATREGLHTEGVSAPRTGEAGECSTLILVTAAWHYTVVPPELPALTGARTGDPELEHPERDCRTMTCRLEVEGTLRTLVQGPGSRGISPEGHIPVPEGVLPRHREDETGYSPGSLLVQAFPQMSNSV